jgi:hypothetical protein
MTQLFFKPKNIGQGFKIYTVQASKDEPLDIMGKTAIANPYCNKFEVINRITMMKPEYDLATMKSRPNPFVKRNETQKMTNYGLILSIFACLLVLVLGFLTSTQPTGYSFCVLSCGVMHLIDDKVIFKTQKP